MKIEVRLLGIDPPADFVEQAERRCHAALSRFAREVRAVSIRVVDVNGPRGGVDKDCQLVVETRRFGTTATSAVHHDLYAAVAQSLERAGRTLGATIERARARRRQARQPTRAS